MKYFSLFSGIGGFELGIQQAYENISTKTEEKRIGSENEKVIRVQTSEFDDEGNTRLDSGGTGLQQYSDWRAVGQPTCVGFSEIDKYAIATYQSHFPNHKNYGDITKINEQELPDFDMLVGGFPCQAFSIAGKRKGFEDTRGTLFFDIARIIKAKQPRLVFLENVKGLLSHDNGETFRTIIATLDELGYDLQWQVLNSKNHGVPQNRERVFIIGHLRGTSRPEVFPFGTGDEKNDLEINILGHKDCYRRANQVFDKNGITETLSTCGGGGQHPCTTDDMKVRRLTPTECERLQGFPDNWTVGSDTQRYKQCGNAVTVNVIRDIAERLL